MKKFLLIVACALASSFTAMASETKSFTDQLEVTINGTSSTQQTTVTVEELEDNYINFVLSNFILNAGDDDMYVGNIEINNLFLSDKGDYKSFSYNANIQIKDGDLAGVDSWMGPLLGNVPLLLKGKIADNKLYVTIDIDMQSSIGQTIYVKFGKDFVGETVVEKTLTVTDVLNGKYTSMDPEEMGTEYILDALSGIETSVELLSNGEANLCIKNLALVLDGEVNPFGDLTLKNVELTNRGSYSDLKWTGLASFESETSEFANIPMSTTLKGKLQDGKLYFTLHIDGTEQIYAILDFTYGTDFAPTTVSGATKAYADNLIVTVNETSTEPIPANVEVEPLTNGGINFVLKNFIMDLGGNQMYVGNIRIEDLPLYQGAGYNYFNYDGNLQIQAGDAEGISEDEWVGPMLGIIPLRLTGRLTDSKLYVTIDIDMESLEQVIHVTFGTQIAPTDAITGVSADTNTNAIYDLQGRRTNRMVQGIYILNGKKILK